MVGAFTYANNLLYGNTSGAYSLIGGDYHIRTGSPAIDKGTANGALNYNLDFILRPQGAAVDICAYEGGR
ncbi:MAG: hypothetical protein JWO41_668 [Candidatus Saccharibacteria bacterium]|nr:hypothetical protein [Candidatus Saccharibacteria bacterium]